MRWVGYVASTGQLKNKFKILYGKPEGKILFWRQSSRYEYNIKIDLE
jgi:hypothetical protein